MRTKLKHTVTLIILTLALLSPVAAQVTEDVIIQTTLGDIQVRLDAEKAPMTVANFLIYVDRGLFSNGRFHRTVTLGPDNQPQNKVKIEVIQAGLADGLEAKVLKPIQLERTHKTGIKHKDGTISMARLGPDTATAEFFICVGDQPELDYGGKRNPDGQGFAAFGRVVKGMDVVRKIHKSPSKGQSLNPPILIQGIYRLRK